MISLDEVLAEVLKNPETAAAYDAEKAILKREIMESGLDIRDDSQIDTRVLAAQL